MYEILHLTKDNQLVALNDKSIYCLDLFSGELIATKEFIHTDEILKCIKGYVFVLTDDRHALDIYIAKDFTKLYHLNIGEAITDIYDIAGDGAKILLQQ